jgi:hypothetical protein
MEISLFGDRESRQDNSLFGYANCVSEGYRLFIYSNSFQEKNQIYAQKTFWINKKPTTLV